MNCQAHGRDYKNEGQAPGNLCQQGHRAARAEGRLAYAAERRGDIDVLAALEKHRANEQDTAQDVNHLNYSHHTMESLFRRLSRTGNLASATPRGGPTCSAPQPRG